MVESITLSQLDTYAHKLVPFVERARIVAFMGPLGAGKTTLIRALARAIGINEPVVSPTFMYVVLYQLPDKRTLYHFDLYRVLSLTQFYDAGFNEYLHQPNSIVFIEWPEVIQSILPPTSLLVCLEYHPTEPEKRVINVLSAHAEF